MNAMTKNLLACFASLLAAIASTHAGAQPDPNKILRYAFEVAESSFDPHKNSDVYSNIVNNAIFDAPLRYDFLARPPKLIANTLVAMPEVSADYKTYTLRVKPGIYFADDAAFGGNKRELTANDYVYSIKRLFDPKLAAPQLSEVEGYIVGSEQLMQRVRKTNQMDYDAPLEGLKALDRYTFQVKLNESKPNWIYNFADGRVTNAVAREVVEKYKEDIVAHPVGTGPYRLTSWKRSSKMVFEFNPNFREEYFSGEPNANDEAGQAILARLKGKRLPMIGRVEVAIINEQQPRWISFLNREFDLLWLMPEDFGNMAVPNRKLAPNLQKAGVVMEQIAGMDLTYIYFNMDDPIVGGYTPDKIALRRAISLGYKTSDEINIIRKALAVPAHTPYPPMVAGSDIAFRTSANEYDPAKARALLDMYGFMDRDGDGYREMPDGTPLVLRFNSSPSDRDKQFDELLTRSMDEIGLKLTVRKAKWPDLLKESNAGKLMMWQLGNTASAPDASNTLSALYGPNAGFKGNRARFKLAAFDQAFEKAEQMPHSPERTKLYQEMARLTVAYAPWKINTHRILTDMWYPYLIGFRRPLIQTQNWWKFVDIDLDAKKQFEAR